MVNLCYRCIKLVVDLEHPFGELLLGIFYEVCGHFLVECVCHWAGDGGKGVGIATKGDGQFEAIGIVFALEEGKDGCRDGLLGKTQGFSPKFLRRYADLHTIMTDAIGHYIEDVKNCDFPNESEQY